jgi:hypothetical protein
MRPNIINNSKQVALTASGDIAGNRFDQITDPQIVDPKKLVANGIRRG